ncbi:MAG: hypothetical protein HN704_16030 [Bacteroidetes bacterium]|jgi:hypothetical protein|nr:hypothetical protein [Bacteroidota bacterium]MBT7142117.1 hypothetical protein [Bacteroidota bacterium]MBT7493106.1 hypothetical protein [Bacteroidota bacterium]
MKNPRVTCKNIEAFSAIYIYIFLFGYSLYNYVQNSEKIQKLLNIIKSSRHDIIEARTLMFLGNIYELFVVINYKFKLNEKGETDRFIEALPELNTSLINLITEIKSKLIFDAEKKETEIDIKTIKNLIPKLKELLEKKNPKAKALIKELEKAGLAGEIFDEIKKKLSKYDFNVALLLIDKLSI